MKNLLILMLGLLLISSFSGCKLWDDTKKSYDNAIEETENVKANILKIKEKTEETINDVGEAVDAVKNAEKKVKEITK